MIYELRTYTLKPGTVGKFEEIWAPMVEARSKLSPLAGIWHTEFGPLNQVLHLWPYASLDERARIRALAVEQKVWPPPTEELIVRMESEILQPAPFMRPLAPAKLGNVYELRIYTYRPGTMPEVIRRWAEAVPYREKYSPLAGAWSSEIGTLNRWYHLWPYASLAERDRIRAEASKEPHWPPPTGEFLLSMENKLLIPASFSPLH